LLTYLPHAVLVYKCLHGSAPAYLTDELCQLADVEAHQRHSTSSSSSLIVRHTRLPTVGDRAFPVAAACVWNSLPDLATPSNSIEVFWSRLKTYLFNISYPFPCDCTVPVQWLWLLWTLHRVPKKETTKFLAITFSNL